MEKVVSKIKGIWDKTEVWQKIAFVAFVLNFFLVAQLFLPHLNEINLWDESDYVHSGVFLIEGLWPSYAWNPLLAIVYAIFYFITRQSPYGTLESITLGRILLFCLLWLAVYLLARDLKEYINPGWLLGIAFVAPLFTDILTNPSDALFGAMAGLTFWQLLNFYKNKSPKNLAGASTFLGLAALSRNDGLILFFVTLALTLVFSVKNKIKLPEWGIAIVVPFWLLVGGYILLFWAVRGVFEFGTPARSYVAFMQGHQLVYSRADDCQLSFQKCAVADAIQKFGSPEENNNSVLKAILRNPGAFLERIKVIILTLPGNFYGAYGMRLAYGFIIFGILGILYLLQTQQYFILSILVSWPLYLVIYFSTFIRPGYLQSSYFILFILSAFGLKALTDQIQNGKRLWVWGGLLVLLTLVGFVAQLPSLYFTTIILLAATIVARLIHISGKLPVNFSPAASMLLFLFAGVLIRGQYPVLVGRAFGEIPEEQALVVLQNSFDTNTYIGAGARGVVYAAHMRHFSLGAFSLVSLSDDEFYQTLKDSDVKGIYVDGTLSKDNKAMWQMIERGIDTRYKVLYSSKDGSIRVLKVVP